MHLAAGRVELSRNGYIVVEFDSCGVFGEVGAWGDGRAVVRRRPSLVGSGVSALVENVVLHVGVQVACTLGLPQPCSAVTRSSVRVCA